MFSQFIRALKTGNFAGDVVKVLKVQYAFTAKTDEVCSLLQSYGDVFWNEDTFAVIFLTSYLSANEKSLKGRMDIQVIRKAIRDYISIAKTGYSSGRIRNMKYVDELSEVARMQYGVH